MFSTDDSELVQLGRESLAAIKLVENQNLMLVSPEQAKLKLERKGLLEHRGEFVTTAALEAAVA